jgi:hypothetical protein
MAAVASAVRGLFPGASVETIDLSLLWSCLALILGGLARRRTATAGGALGGLGVVRVAGVIACIIIVLWVAWLFWAATHIFNTIG